MGTKPKGYQALWERLTRDKATTLAVIIGIIVILTMALSLFLPFAAENPPSPTPPPPPSATPTVGSAQLPPGA